MFVPDELSLDLGQRWRRVFFLEILQREDRGDEARLDLACQLAWQASAAVDSLTHPLNHFNHKPVGVPMHIGTTNTKKQEVATWGECYGRRLMLGISHLP